MTVGTDQLSVDLLNLEASTKYCIQLAGFTRIGDGDRSACLYATTAEKSVSCGINNYVNLLRMRWYDCFGGGQHLE